MKISARDTWPVAALLLLAALVLLPGIEEPGLFDHEARYAEVARQMYASGDWVTPRFNGTVFLNKPPLVYWLTAAAFYAVGINERARAWASAVGISLIFVTYFLGRAVGSRRVGLLAALVLVSSVGFFVEGRMIRTDVILTLLLAAALLGFMRASTATDASVRSRWFLGGTAALAMSFLAKGLVGPVLAGVVILGVVVCRGLPFSGHAVPWLAAFAIVLAVVLPWHVIVGLRTRTSGGTTL